MRTELDSFGGVLNILKDGVYEFWYNTNKAAKSSWKRAYPIKRKRSTCNKCPSCGSMHSPRRTSPENGLCWPCYNKTIAVIRRARKMMLSADKKDLNKGLYRPLRMLLWQLSDLDSMLHYLHDSVNEFLERNEIHLANCTDDEIEAALRRLRSVGMRDRAEWESLKLLSRVLIKPDGMVPITYREWRGL